MTLLSLLVACTASFTFSSTPTDDATTTIAPEASPVVVETPAAPAGPGGCGAALNTCPSYAPSWGTTCPAGARCLTFTNACATPVNLSYQTGCNGDGTKGAPQCDCTAGPTIAPKSSVTWTIVDGDYTSCLPSWTPACLTAGLAVLATTGTASCTAGVTRIEFTAGNAGDPYSKFDNYDLDVEKGYGVPVSFAPVLAGGCAIDAANHDCRPLVCDSATCPDAYQTPTTGGCADGRSPQAGCRDTFSGNEGYIVTFCPTPMPKSCQDAVVCPSTGGR